MSRRTNTSSAERAARIARRDMRKAGTPLAYGETPARRDMRKAGTPLAYGETPAARAARVAVLRKRIAST